MDKGIVAQHAGLAFVLLWLMLAFSGGASMALACAIGLALGAEAYFAIDALLGPDMLREGLGRRAFAVECAVLMVLAAPVAWGGGEVTGVGGALLAGAGALGCALALAAWFDRVCALSMEEALAASLGAGALALLAAAGVFALAYEPGPVWAVALAVCAAGSAVCLAVLAGNDDATAGADAGAAALGGLLARFGGDGDAAVDASAPSDRRANDASLPAPSRAFLASVLVPFGLLAFYFGFSHPFARSISAAPQSSLVAAGVLTAALFVMMLAWIVSYLRDSDARHAMAAALLVVLLAALVALFVDRDNKTALMAVQVVGRPASAMLLWLAALAFVKRGTYSPFRALPFAQAVFFFAAAAGLAVALLPVTNEMLSAFPREGIYLFSGIMVVLLGYELAVSGGFFREGAAYDAHGTDAEGAASVESDASPAPATAAEAGTPTLEARCETLAAERNLTERELEIVRLLARGRSRGHIASTLYLSENTVKWYCRQIYQKLDIHSKQELLTLLGVEG